MNGSARAIQFLGWVGSRLQTGQVGAYVLVFVIGVVLLLRAVTRQG